MKASIWLGGGKSMRIVVFAMACAALAAGSAHAQPLDAERLNLDTLRKLQGTIEVDMAPYFAGGRLEGCSVGFRTLTQDWIYKQGAFITVSGSFGVMNIKGTYVGYLKVTVNDVDPRTMQFTPSPPASAYFVAGNTTTKEAVVSSDPSDQPGTIFVVSHVGPTLSVFGKGLADGKVTIAFARQKGVSDVTVSIDTTVVDIDQTGQRKRSDQISTDFLKCAQTLQEQSK